MDFMVFGIELKGRGVIRSETRRVLSKEQSKLDCFGCFITTGGRISFCWPVLEKLMNFPKRKL